MPVRILAAAVRTVRQNQLGHQ